jgi:hypothetical protein
MTDNSKRLATREQVKNLIKAAGIKHFGVDEVLVKTSSTSAGGVKNSMPPVGLIYNCIPTLLVLDAFRAKLNDRVILLSGFRNDGYNQSIGGAELSSHKDFRAFDFTAASGTPEEWAKMLDEMRGMPFPCPVMMDVVAGVGPFRPDLLKVNNTLQGSAFIFHGGINAYNTFCHVDTRGIDVSW